MAADLQNNKGVLNNGGRQKRRITTIERDAIKERVHQQGVVNNKGKSIVYDDTSVETQYSNATHAIPNTSSPENQNQRMEQNCLPDACITSDSTPSCNEEGSGLRPEIVESLIRVLDEHNELVQVFKTARDKVNDGIAEEFKIQLYNVVGTREYQLPSSGTLGAIVFQPDANSQTDYDVIIEYRDRGPQRINKLHSSYMSLQYPLLFVYGQPGFNTKMTLEGVNASTKRTKLSMNMFYKYQLHERFGQVVDPEDKSRREYPVLTDYIGCYISSGEKETVGDPMRDQMGVRFTCDGRITGINTSRDWYYPACTSCNLKLENNDGIYDCKVHGPIDNPTYRYNFKGYLTDDTATATITFFTPRANQIVGIDCNSLLSSLQDRDPRNVPQKIQSIIGKRHIFQFYYNTTSKQGPAEFIFATLLDQLATMKKLTDIPSGSATYEEAGNIINPTIPEQDVLAPIECSLSSTPATDTQQIPSPALQEKHGDQPVAPTIAYTGMQTRSRTELAAESSVPEQQVPATTEYDLFSQGASDAEEMVSHALKEKHPQRESTEGKQVIAQTTELHTPPTSQDVISNPLSKTSGTDTTKTTIPKRQLFQEKTPDPKKTKKD
ncbi:Retrotransposon-like protein [Artemisia annua]|uniref:Retrotransposon-like protein n=1 Tax=Artemisia annua TaxID=35608 RepID=A0A2U1MQ19_ARTAN|nr:Retrotransposon-like protein [Artemisia annua]